MKHVGKVSVSRNAWTRNGVSHPDFADAKTDFMNAIWKAWSDFVVQKKNEVSL